MIIAITKSEVFTCDPAIRFAKEYSISQNSWIDLWRKYKLLDYSNRDMRDYIFIKYGRHLGTTSMSRWIARGEVYSITKPLIKKGVKHVNTEIFGKYEDYVINELVKPLKYGAIHKSESII